MAAHVLHPEGATLSMPDGPAGSGWGASISDLGLIQYSVFSNCSSTVTVSPSGPIKLFKGVTTAMST